MSETPTSTKFISHGACFNLNEVQWLFKILPVREVDVKLINNIGFFDLDSMADVEAFIVNCLVWSRKKRPIQILYEDHTFTTFFPGREVPHWFSNKNGGSTISFTATLSPHFHFRGLNLCLVYTLPTERDWLPHPLHFEINSKSSGMKRVYTPSCYGIPKEGGDMVWLSHWNFQPNLFTEGDEVEVSFRITGDGQIKECGVHLFCFEGGGELLQYLTTICDWNTSLLNQVLL
ncbi:hypothetical protein Vadar_027599 [Vaccinium darrowii]|uniref:Uncharacterized protein n=1 Tax=Vaccinium darrowii TaxID=229202 RepID=A0ACB7X4F2_9ERIC|nr:hypothetical protein Vadar_027599 [Vaccinium darrowii]